MESQSKVVASAACDNSASKNTSATMAMTPGVVEGGSGPKGPRRKLAQHNTAPTKDRRLVPASVLKVDRSASSVLNPSANVFTPSFTGDVPSHSVPQEGKSVGVQNPRRSRPRKIKQPREENLVKDGDNQNIDASELVPKGQQRNRKSKPKADPVPDELNSSPIIPDGEKDSKRREPRPNKKITKVEPSIVVEPVADEDLVELSCPICTDSAAYFAVGKCNHHVCSLCAVRMRVKSKDTHCAICKENLSVMIIYHPIHGKQTGAAGEENQVLRPFNSFGLTAADCDVDNGNIPGVQVDPSAGFLFVDCPKHYSELETLRAMVCPFKQCKARFPTIQTLQRHLKDQHKDSTLCTLCVENRPLFISEHTVMNQKQLMCHFKGEEFVEAQGQHGHRTQAASENVHTKGHPQCEFCTERFFDNAALYNHMQRQYFTCHLCPRQHMFRYYMDAAALREHHHRDHIVCNICAAVPTLLDSDVAIAFRDAREYSDHMRHIHNSHVSAASGGSNYNKTSFRLGASSTYQTNNPSSVRRDKNGKPRRTVVDLDMGTADPNARPGSETAGTNSHARAAAMGRPVDNAAALIPPNMRIAGRVTGAGRFAPLDSQDLLMQAAADEYAAAAERETRGQKKSMRLSHQQAFPALSASTAPVAAPTNRVWSAKVSAQGGGEYIASDSSANQSPVPVRPAAASAVELHPMSLLHSSKQLAKDLQRRKDAEAAEKAQQEKLRQEDKRIERNLSLASALLNGGGAGKGKAVSLTAAEVGATLKNRSYVSSIIAPLAHLEWSESDLMRPIYPPVLVNWARLHQTDLLKIEKKINALMTDPQSNSVQLKPMVRGMRIVVHQLSRMYLLNSYEYDPEPNRYVSLVKQVDSYLPAHVLSRAAALPVYTLPGENGSELPDLHVVFLTLSSESYSAGLANTNSSVSTAGKKAPGSGVAGSSSETVRIAFTVAEVVSRIKDLLESPELWRAWYQYALEVGAPVVPVPVVFSENDELAEFEQVTPPPPPPGMASSPMLKPRSLSELPLPRIVGLVNGGASSVGLRFPDRASAQFAFHFMNFCVSLHYSSVGSNTKMSSRVQSSLIALDTAQLSSKQQQELTVLSVFTLNAAFSVCKVVDLVYDTPLNVQLDTLVRQPGTDVPSATLDRRHYMPSVEDSWTTVSKSAPKAVAAVAPTATAAVSAAAKGLPMPVGADGWQFQAVKTRKYEAEDDLTMGKAVPFQSMPVQESWEDLAQFSDFNQKPPAVDEEAQSERAEEWESFLNEKRSKADIDGVARYQPKRTESTGPAKYVPPSARNSHSATAVATANDKQDIQAAEEEHEGEDVFVEGVYAVSGESAEPVDEEEYDLCDHTLSGGAETSFQTSAAPAQTYDTDYLNSEEAFEEYLRQLQLQHEDAGPAPRQQQQVRNPTEVTAMPFNAALSHVGPSVYNNFPASAMAVVAIPISDDVSDEEAAREALRKQVKKEKGASQYNKFGVLDEEDADNDA